MVDTNWGDFGDRSYVDIADVFLVAAGGGGINIPGDAFVARRSDGVFRVGVAGGPSTTPTMLALDGTYSSVAGNAGGIKIALLRAGNEAYGFGLNPFAGLEYHAGNYSVNDNATHDFYTSGALRLRISTGALAPGGDATMVLGSAPLRWSTVFAASGAISTSDRDAKQQIEAISDEWLNAWTLVEWRRFKFNDAVAEKGEKTARWHFGLIAQEVRDVLEAQGIDGRSWGLLCYDAWDEQREPIFREVKRTRKTPKLAMVPVDVEGHPGAVIPQMVEVDEEYSDQEDTGQTRVTREAGERWGIRYDLAQAIEAAYQRRRADRLEAALEALVARVDALAA